MKRQIFFMVFIFSFIMVGTFIFMAMKQTGTENTKQNEALKESIQEKQAIEQISQNDPYWFTPYYTNEAEIVKHQYYILKYNEQFEQPDWVAYELKQAHLVKNAKRANNFRADKTVLTGSAVPDDYNGSGYDRGHLLPAGDRPFSEEAMSETFYMSNMSPQEPGFNRGIWKVLEDAVRTYAENIGTMYVVTGPVNKLGVKEIGMNKVDVPNYYYKAVLFYSDNQTQAIGFLLKNESSDLPIQNFVITIDSLEKFTGINFYHKLDDSIENNMESKVDTKFWFK